MRIAIASDHAGFDFKQKLLASPQLADHQLNDYGPGSAAAVDYPDYAHRVAGAVARGEAERGILICGTGIGMAIAANRIAGARAVNLYSADSARLSREHNDANIATLGARLLSLEQSSQLLALWLATPFLAGRHQLRVAKIEG